MKKVITMTLLSTAATLTLGQSRSSFEPVLDLTGITFIDSQPSFTVMLDSDPTFSYLGSIYHVTDVFAFYLLDDEHDLFASGVDDGVWTFNSNDADGGNIAGWQTNPNTGLGASGMKTFVFDSLTGTYEQYGIHVRVSEPIGASGDDTLYITPVPEPASLAGFGILALALLRRRRT